MYQPEKLKARRKELKLTQKEIANRCIVLSFGVGIILGDLPTALAMGAIGELAYMGFGVGAVLAFYKSTFS